MTKILIPVDGSERSLQAVRQAIQSSKALHSLEIQLLNVQPRIFAEETLVFMPVDKIDSYYYERSSKALTPAAQLLSEAAVPFVAHRAVGPIAETIVEKSRQLECDSILMSTRGDGSIAGLLLGSVSTKVLHLADLPVTLVKDKSRPDFTGRLQAT